MERMMKRWLGALSVALMGMAAAVLLAPDAALAQTGQPAPWQKGLQTPVTDIAEQINWFHDTVNIVICLIAAFVLLLLIIVVVKFNERANPVPSKTSHNTALEVAWTFIPVLILVGIAIPSFKLLFAQYTYPTPDLTIKATGNQWNWTHAYPDHMMANNRPVEFVTTMLQDAEREELIKKGIPAPRLLAVNNEVVVPVNKNVHVIVTASDVIHNWTVPSFGSKVDAVPGRITATWFRAKREGVFYGQCSELCGKDHAFMPIAVRVVKESVFNEWIAAMKARDRNKARSIIEKAALEHAGVKAAAAPETTEKVAAASAAAR
jgi:cytochrome c oxidase subunit 2